MNANSRAVGPLQYCYPNEAPYYTSAIDQSEPVHIRTHGEELYMSLYRDIYLPSKNKPDRGESSTTTSTQLLHDQHRPPGFLDTIDPEHYLAFNSPYDAEQINPVTRNQLGFDLNEPPEHNPEEISNTPNISIQPFAQTDATGQGFNYDLNQEPTDYQD